MTTRTPSRWSASSAPRRPSLVAASMPRSFRSPVKQPDGGTIVVDRDEHPRPAITAEELAALRPAFRDGRHRHGRQLVGHQRWCGGARARGGGACDASSGVRPLARVLATAVAGVDPAIMGIGPVPATRKALERAGLAVAATSTSSSSTRPSRARRSPASASWDWIPSASTCPVAPSRWAIPWA